MIIRTFSLLRGDDRHSPTIMCTSKWNREVRNGERSRLQ